MNDKKLILEQLDKKLDLYKQLENSPPPQRGWLFAIRKAINMSLRQMGQRMHLSAQGVRDIEERERSGALSLKGLRQAGQAMNLKLVYGFIPEASSLEQMIEDRAMLIAREIVERTSMSMELEDQKNTTERLQKAINEKASAIKEERPRYLWD